jgi:uncharacterized protein (TIGR04255 family)
VTLPRGQLPEFDKPPVIEVALGVQFDPLFGVGSSEIVEFWADKIRSRFPKAETAPPIAPAVEWFGVAGAPVQLSVQFGPIGTQERWLFADAGTNQLVQVQQDRFVRNWRKIGSADSYPRYPTIRKGFEEDFRAFSGFLQDHDIKAPVPNQCEVTYVNHIELPAETAQGDPKWFLSSWSGDHSDSFLSRPESVETTARYVIESNGESVGRLHIAARPAVVSRGGTPVFLLTLTARGRPAERTLEGVLNFLDLGRQYVVRGFASVTTPQAHKLWGRRYGSGT